MKNSNLKSLSDVLKIIRELDTFKLPVLIISALLSAAVPFSVALLSAEILNRLYKGQNGTELIRFAVFAVLIIFVLTVLSSWVKKIDAVKSKQCERLYNLRKSKKLMEMDFPELENPAINETLIKIRTDEMMGFNLSEVFSCLDSIIKGIFSIVLTMIWLSPIISGIKGSSALWLALFVAGSLVISALTSLAFKKSNDKVFVMIRTFNTPEMSLSENLMYMGGYTYKDGKDTRIYGFQDTIRACFDTSFVQMRAFTIPCCVKPAIALGLSGISRALSMGLSYLFGALLVLNGSLELGTVVLFAALLYQCSDSLTYILSMGGFIFACAEGMQKTVEFTATPDSQYKGKIPVEKRDDNDFTIEFNNVSFKYPGSDDYALKDFSIKFKIGERLAIVGMNGSGKTTMIKLLCRLCDPTEGEILLNGVDVKKYDMKEYMSVFSVVAESAKCK